MSNSTQDTEYVREVVQGTIVGNYMNYANLAVLVYDMGEPSLIYASLSDGELVLSLDKEVRPQSVRLWRTACLQSRQRRSISGYGVLTSSMQLSCNHR